MFRKIKKRNDVYLPSFVSNKDHLGKSLAFMKNAIIGTLSAQKKKCKAKGQK